MPKTLMLTAALLLFAAPALAENGGAADRQSGGISGSHNERMGRDNLPGSPEFRFTPRRQTHGAYTYEFTKPFVGLGSGVTNRDSFRSQPGNNSYTGHGDIGGRIGGPR